MTNPQSYIQKLIETNPLREPVLREAVQNDGLRIVTAFFRFTTGEVEFD